MVIATCNRSCRRPRTAIDTARPLARSLRYWVPLSLLTLIAGVLTWLNRSPWWGWVLVVALLLVTGAAARWWTQGHLVLQIGAWLLAGTIVAAAAVLAHPVPQLRLAGGEDRAPSRPVETQQDRVIGVYNDERTVEVFAGIPYAQPPVGDLRWRAPQPLEARTDVLSADRFSAVPVLVYIPGGGFTTGSGALPLYDGEALASSGELLTVTINYWLGVLGFLSHPELAAESGNDASGNYGILDQIAALEWVRDNVAAFGGDPGPDHDRMAVSESGAGVAPAGGHRQDHDPRHAPLGAPAHTDG